MICTVIQSIDPTSKSESREGRKRGSNSSAEKKSIGGKGKQYKWGSISRQRRRLTLKRVSWFFFLLQLTMTFTIDQSTFWAQRASITRTNTLPAVYEQMKSTGRWDSLKLKWKPGDDNQPHHFWDSDIAKALESLCYALRHLSPSDPLAQKFQTWIDDAIDMIEKAQHPDGYINTYFTVVEPGKKWTDLAHMHELYCAGHLLEAAIAHYSLTGKTRFLDIMLRYINHIRDVFGPEKGQKKGYCGHEEIELALVRLYEIKPEPEYLELLKYFVEYRGADYGEYYAQEAVANGYDPDKYIDRDGQYPNPPQYWYMQAHCPIREQDEIVGHSVRALYFLTGVEGLANITDDGSLHDAVYKQWRNMIDKKFYAHGGIGAKELWEGFGENYELPLDCYAETCASIALIFLGKRMLERKLDGEVSRVMSRALYNDVIGGASLDGRSFYYDQPLVGNGHKRSDWFEVSCCPPNFTRLFNSLEDYVITKSSSSSSSVLSLDLYISGCYESDLADITVSTKYPEFGNVSVDIKPKTSSGLNFAVALPGSKNYECSSDAGKEKNGYLYFNGISQQFSFELKFDVSPVLTQPDPNVKATEGKVLIERGPFIYGIEQIDCPIPLSEFTVPKEGLDLKEKYIEIENTAVTALVTTFKGQEYQFVPYFVLGNRKPGDKFITWLDVETNN